MAQRRKQTWASSAASTSSGQGAADASMASSPVPTSTISERSDKKSKFDKRFKTDTTSNEDVLS